MTQASTAVPTLRGRFSASDSALAGFELVRREPKTVLIWGGVLLIYALVTNVGLLGLLGPQLQAARSGLGRGAPADPAALARSFGALSPFYGLSFIIFLLLFGVLNAAVLRTFLRPNEGGPGRLTFGVDELLQIALAVILWLMLVVVYIGAILLFLILGAIAAAASSPVLAVLSLVVGVVATIGVMVWFAVRMSLAFPLTFDTRRLHVFSAFRLSKGRFWALLGAFSLSWIVAFVIGLVFLVVVAALGFSTGAGGLAGLGAVFQRDLSSPASLLSPVLLVSLLIGPFVQAVQWALVAGAPASAYAHLRGTRVADVF